jgi:autotransporter-associated beta strand protein
MVSNFVHGATYTWDGGSTSNNNWSTAANWANATDNNAVPPSGANIVFGTSSDAAVLDSARTIGSMTFNIGSSFAISAASGSLTINTGITTSGSSDTYTIDPAIVLGGNNVWSIGSATTLSISSAISDGGSGFGLTKSGGGTLLISTPTTYTGTTTITAGTLIYNTNNAINSNSAVVVSGSSAVLQIGNATARTAGFSGLTLDGGGTVAGNAASVITVNTGSYDLRSGSVSIPLNGSAGLTKTTSGSVEISSTSGLTGAVIVRQGTLQLTDVNGALPSASGVSIESGATLQLDNTVSSGINNDRIGAVDVTLNGGVLHYMGDDGNTRSTETISRLLVSNGASTLTLAGASSNGNGSAHALLTLDNGINSGAASSDIVRSAGATLYFVTNSLSEVDVTNYSLAGGIIPWAVYGSGTFATLSGANTGSIVAATFTDNPTTTSWASGQNIRLSTSATRTVNPVGASTSINSLIMSTNASTISISSGKSLIVESGGIIMTTAGQLITGSGTLTAGAADAATPYELIVHSTTANTGTISSVIGDNGVHPVSFTKSGYPTSVLKVTADNTYTGNTYISAGTLSLNSSTSNNNIASSPVISLQSGGILDVSGVTAGGGFKLATNQKLRGTGSVWGAFTADAGSTIAPGNSPGQITFTGNSSNVTLNTNATIEMQIGGASGGIGTAGVDYDQIVVSGTSKTLNLGTALLKILPMPGIVTNQAYRIVTTNSGASIASSSIFQNLAHTYLNAGGGPYSDGLVQYNISYGYTSGSSYVDVTFTQVPEPSAMALLALSAGTLLRRRRRAARAN